MNSDFEISRVNCLCFMTPSFEPFVKNRRSQGEIKTSTSAERGIVLVCNVRLEATACGGGPNVQVPALLSCRPQRPETINASKYNTSEHYIKIKECLV